MIDRHMVGEVRQSLETLEKEQEMRETAGQTVHRRKGDSPKLRMRRGKLSVRSIAALAAACIVLVALPIISWAAGIEPSYTWYTNHDAGDDTYVLSNESDYAGFVSLVNGTADVDGSGASESASFAGKTVRLGADLNFKGQTIAPAGGQNGKTFEGIFDGGGKRIDNFVLDTGNTVNIGLIGKAGQNSVIKNLTVGSAASLSLSLRGGE